MTTWDAENTYQVFDWLWTSGQLSQVDIASLPQAGFSVVINLATPDSPSALTGEAELVTGLGLNYYQIPIQWEAPRLEQFKLFSTLLGACCGQKIWLHCAKNMRVSAYVYLYRFLVLHEPEEEAVHPMRDIWQPEGVWKEHIEAVRVAYGNIQP
jgi:protein tyrosine phosphatase (PTP) superfamily phosphohydrolase (DUF442 family)